MRISVRQTTDKDFPLTLEFNRSGYSSGFRHLELLKKVLRELRSNGIIQPLLKPDALKTIDP